MISFSFRSCSFHCNITKLLYQKRGKMESFFSRYFVILSFVSYHIDGRELKCKRWRKQREREKKNERKNLFCQTSTPHTMYNVFCQITWSKITKWLEKKVKKINHIDFFIPFRGGSECCGRRRIRNPSQTNLVVSIYKNALRLIWIMLKRLLKEIFPSPQRLNHLTDYYYEEEGKKDRKNHFYQASNKKREKFIILFFNGKRKSERENAVGGIFLSRIHTWWLAFYYAKREKKDG